MKLFVSNPYLTQTNVRHNLLLPVGHPDFDTLKSWVDKDVPKINRYHNLTHYQAVSERAELSQLRCVPGKPSSASFVKKIGVDAVSFQDSMEDHVGKDWPSLARDFHVTPRRDRVTGKLVEERELKFNFDSEKAAHFKGILSFSHLFERLGIEPSGFRGALFDMKQAEDDLFDGNRNPYPKGIGAEPYLKESMIYRNRMMLSMRSSFTHYFNKRTQDYELYLRIRFEAPEDPNEKGQKIVFTFPTSNEERQIFQHVFWGYEVPAGGFPLSIHSDAKSGSNSFSGTNGQEIDGLSSHLGNLGLQNDRPPAYQTVPIRS